MHFDNLNSKITLGWVVFGIVLLLINLYTKKVLMKIIGTVCLVTSISAYLISNIFSRYPKYIYLETALLVILGIALFFIVRKITKLDQEPKKTDEEN